MRPKPIRAFARGLAVIEALNRHGSASALQLAGDSGIPRPTVYRLLGTLIEAGYVGRGLEDDRFHLRMKARTLAAGFRDEHWIAAVAAPLLMELTDRISWPCDVCTLDGLQMVVRDTTHSARRFRSIATWSDARCRCWEARRGWPTSPRFRRPSVAC